MSSNCFVLEKPILSHYGQYRNCYFYSDEEYPCCRKHKKIWDGFDCNECEFFVSHGDVEKYVDYHIKEIIEFYLNHVNETRGNT